jgi:homoserine dehydrogenase
MNYEATGGDLSITARPRATVLRVGLLGCGTVGTPVARALLDGNQALGTGCRRAVGAHPGRGGTSPQGTARRPAREIVTTDALAVAIDPDIDIVIELIGGLEPLSAPSARRSRTTRRS